MHPPAAFNSNYMNALMKTKPSHFNNKGKAAVKKKSIAKARKQFPVVGFGASVGGLEDFSDLLKHLDVNLGMAYVLIIHLSPNHKSGLHEILQSRTTMQVHTVRDRMKVTPNNIYVIPPKAYVSIVDGHLKIDQSSKIDHGNFAVDYFFTVLASVYRNSAIGVILSGTATDGTLGLKYIKTHGGITFAQNESAKFPGMPTSAYGSGCADFKLSPRDIAGELKRLAKLPYTVLPPRKIETIHVEQLENHTEELKNIFDIVKQKFDVDFFVQYKQASLYRRIVRRMIINKVENLIDYGSILETNEKEIDELYNDFLINVTDFFRDPAFFKILTKKVFPSIIKQRKSNDPLRIWVAGCATGEEAYSITICLIEFLILKGLTFPIHIFASDLDAKAIEKARLGIYPASALQDVSENYIKQYFKKINGHYQIVKHVRELCVFSQQNLLKDPPFSRMDLISCQNVMIYLEASPQKKILQTFHYALKSTGYLFLGKSETIGNSNDLFKSHDKKIRLYSRIPTSSPPFEITQRAYDAVAQIKRQGIESWAEVDIEKEMGRVLLSRFVPASVVLNQNLIIIQFFGNTSSYLSPVAGKASFNVLKMIREDLLVDVRSLLQQVKKTEKTAVKTGITIYNNKVQHEVSIEIVPKKIATELYYLVVFKEEMIIHPRIKNKGKQSGASASVDQKEQTIIKLEHELIQSRELIRTTNEQFETTYEELQANNEEISSSNEELQSVNEELETSKEELQSTNEELTTINEELQKRNIELKESQNYAEAIVQTMHNPLLILTGNLQIRMANKAFYQTFKLAHENTEGKFIYELSDGSWDIRDLRDQLHMLMGKTISFHDFEIKHHFPLVGELTLMVHTYKLVNVKNTKETLILLAFNNISELLKSNNEFKRVNEQLEQFAFISSHDLQEPLRKIETFSSFLASPEADLNAYASKYLDKIKISSSRMSALLKDTLQYSTLLIKDENKFVPVDLNEIIHNIIQDFELTIESKKAVINIEPMPMVFGEPVRLSQLFRNLIDNALKLPKKTQ